MNRLSTNYLNWPNHNKTHNKDVTIQQDNHLSSRGRVNCLPRTHWALFSGKWCRPNQVALGPKCTPPKPDGSEDPKREDTEGVDCSFKPAPLVIAEQDGQWEQDEDNYVTELRRLATRCNFEDTTDWLPGGVDHFVFGLRTESTRKFIVAYLN